MTGSTGYVGGAVLRGRPPGTLRALQRTKKAAVEGIEVTVGDLRDSAACERLLDGADVVLHCASYIGPSEDLATDVNDHGTRTLVEAAKRAGVARIIYVSTTGVYGHGPFVGASEDTTLSPVSPTSRSRLEAEQHVLAAGGTVIRPHIVYGVGDTRVLPAALRALRAVGGVPFPSPLVSALSTTQLAAQVWALVAREDLAGQAVNANHGAPVRLSRLVEMAGSATDLEMMSANDVFRRVQEVGASEHQAWMLAAHNHFSSSLADGGSPAVDDNPRIRQWYRDWARAALIPESQSRGLPGRRR
ncbi:NAD-dependent epimerase/dehydratase family protein [Microbacterium sp. LMC-P-041]|uniref:NAD-dependent epimerase/dehydratase family protein n=1 Tax=Microbacterium sp. LMC-P-041 TaxID=3040293 RepID=UPI0025530F7E|nr:NAD-dependent epimerase/dehydratase family protein [Microbacterium sp. LMC-P-041]